MTIAKKISIFGIIGILFMFSGVNLPSKYGKAKVFSLMGSQTNNKQLKKELSKLNEMKVSEKGYTPITAAISEGRVDVLKYLAKKGFTPLEEDYVPTEDENLNPIFLSILSGRVETIEYLVENGQFDLEFISEKNKRQPLHFAAQKCMPEITDYLISQNVDLNPVDTYGDTALIIAAKKKCIPVLSILLEAGANPLIKNSKEKSASNYIRGDKMKYLLSRKESILQKQISRGIASEKKEK